MEKNTFDKLCELFGDPALAVNERWRSIAYLSVPSLVMPLGSVSAMIKNDEFLYVSTGGIDGFLFLQYLDAAHDTLKTGYTIDFIPLDQVQHVAFNGINDYESYKDKEITGISDIVTLTTDIVPTVFPTYLVTHNVTIGKSKVANWHPDFNSSRTLEMSDIDIIYKDKLGNELNERPTVCGEYTYTIKCKGKYIGESTAKLEIVPDDSIFNKC